MNDENRTPAEEGKPPSGKRESNLTTGVVLIAVGALFLLHNLEWLNLGRYWPLLLIVAGVGLLLKRNA
jgi:hypothetical protein